MKLLLYHLVEMIWTSSEEQCWMLVENSVHLDTDTEEVVSTINRLTQSNLGQWHMLQKPVLETATIKLVPVSGMCDMQSGADFSGSGIWRQIEQSSVWT